ncbi:hypothetical protein FACS189413_09530 [Bacteroidia bacterium]|nr:hypothetical protein FACS189413_09530 [Bacteroidia bacterium]
MEKLIYSLAVFLLFTACSSFENQVEEAVHRQMQLFPQSHLQDLYKNFFQDRFGPGHLIPDSAMAGEYLRSELSEYSCYQPLIEELGWEGNFVRISLEAVVNNRISQEQYIRAFVESANTTPSVALEDWNREWNRILTVIEKMNLQLPDFEAEKAKLQNLIDSGKYAVHHSETFEEAYRPHYRVIRKKVGETLLLK